MQALTFTCSGVHSVTFDVFCYRTVGHTVSSLFVSPCDHASIQICEIVRSFQRMIADVIESSQV